MKKVTQTVGILAAIALCAPALGCSPAQGTPSSEPQAQATAATESGSPSAAPGAGQTEAKPVEGKTSAPVKVTLTSSARSGTVVLTLTVEALADIPRGIGRIIVPREAKLVKGTPEVDFGAVPRGETREIQVTLDVPAATRAQVFAGVDCHITSGIHLHQEAKPIPLGE
jgi:hypothetical protein